MQSDFIEQMREAAKLMEAVDKAAYKHSLQYRAYAALLAVDEVCLFLEMAATETGTPDTDVIETVKTIRKAIEGETK